MRSERSKDAGQLRRLLDANAKRDATAVAVAQDAPERVGGLADVCEGAEARVRGEGGGEERLAGADAADVPGALVAREELAGGGLGGCEGGVVEGLACESG